MHVRPVKSVSSRPVQSTRLALTALLAGVAMLASACGQKGPLTLPAANSSAASAPAR